MTETNKMILTTGDAQAVADHLAQRAETVQPSMPVHHQARQALRALACALVARRDDERDSFELTPEAVHQQIALANIILARHAQTSTTEGRWALRVYLEDNCPGYDDMREAHEQPAAVSAAHLPVVEYVRQGIEAQAVAEYG